MSELHILRTKGHYIGQIRDIGCRTWRTVTGECCSPHGALSDAGLEFKGQAKRIRVLYVPTGDTGSYYEPSLWFEGKKP